MPPLGVGLVGCGRVARRHHLDALRRAPDVRPVAVHDVDPAAMGAMDGLRAHPSLEALLADPEVEVVAVCVPAQAHAEVAIAALQAGRHVFVEKPLAPTVADARRIEDAARAATGRTAMGFNLRCHRKVARLARLVRSGRLGRIRAIRSLWEEPPDTRDRGVPPLLDRGIHHVDLWSWLLGAPVEEPHVEPEHVTATVAGVPAELRLGEAPDSANVLEVEGERGSARADLYTIGEWRGFSALRHPGEVRHGGPYQGAFVRQWAAVGTALRSGGAPPATLADGRRALEVLLGA
jgi:myo-inositol 2-dehydrogenase / D-chiro-inositol 1-dehydrogenase